MSQTEEIFKEMITKKRNYQEKKLFYIMYLTKDLSTVETNFV